MATEKAKIKTGIGGSRNGKNRYVGAETLKRDSKKQRRRIDKQIIKEERENK